MYIDRKGDCEKGIVSSLKGEKIKFIDLTIKRGDKKIDWIHLSCVCILYCKTISFDCDPNVFINPFTQSLLEGNNKFIVDTMKGFQQIIS